MRGKKRRGCARASSFFARLRSAGLSLSLLAVLGVLSPASLFAQATTVYLGDAVSSINPGDDDERRLNRLRGSSVVTYTKGTLAGRVTPPSAATQLTKVSGGTAIVWYTDPLDAVRISGNITFNFWARESQTQANAGLVAELLRASASGAIQSVISAVTVNPPTGELNTTLSVENWTATPAPTDLANGERQIGRASCRETVWYSV